MTRSRGRRRPYARIAGTDGRRATRWVYGVNAVERRIRTDPGSIDDLRLQMGSHPRRDELEMLARKVGISVSREEAGVLRDLTGTEAHQGIAASTLPYRYRELNDVLGESPGGGLILDQIQDPHNLGALIRTAAATGIKYIVIPRHGAAEITPAAEKSASGAVCDVPICMVANIARTVDSLKARGVWTIALVPRDAPSLFEMDIPEPVALVIGGEHGLRPLVRKSCDLVTTIPMASSVESLNASVAGALAMYELFRRAPRA